MTTSMTEDPADAWLIDVEWTNSTPTHYGPFPTDADAEAYAAERFANEPTVYSYDIALMVPVSTGTR